MNSWKTKALTSPFSHMECTTAASWPRIQVSNEHLLRKELFSSTTPFDLMVRPVLNSSEAVKVNFKVELKSVVDVVSSTLGGVLFTGNNNVDYPWEKTSVDVFKSDWADSLENYRVPEVVRLEIYWQRVGA